MKDGPKPVETYEDARWWLLANLPQETLEGVIVRKRGLPPSMRLVCDVFWISESKLRADLLKNWKEVGG